MRWKSLRPRGFAMVGLFVTLSVTGTLLAVALPRVSATLRGVRLNGAVSQLAADLEFAQMLATRQQAPVRIAFDTAAREYSITDRNAGTILRRQLAEHQVTSINASPEVVEIMPAGRLTERLSVTLGSTIETQQVVVSRAGQIHIVR